MELDSIYKIILLIGGMLSFGLSFFLWFYPRSIYANRYLALLSLLWSGTMLSFALQSMSFYVQFPHLFGLATGSVLMFFPLLYIYTKAYVGGENKLRLKYLWHFLPVVFFFVAYSPFYFQTGTDKILHFRSGLPGWLDYVFNIGTVAVVVQGLLYSVFSLRVVQNKEIDEGAGAGVTWLKYFILTQMLLWAIGTTSFALSMLKIDIPVDLFKVYYLGLSVLNLSIGAVSLTKPSLFSKSNLVTDTKPRPVDEKPAELPESADESSYDEKYYTADVVRFLSTFQEKRPYLDNDLNLQSLSQLTDFSRNQISEMLNTYIGKSFYDFINEYRVEEFLSLVDQGLYEQHTLSYLYESAGFNSKATFNRFFKKVTGFTPTVYIQNLPKK